MLFLSLGLTNCVKCQVSKQVLIEGFLDNNGLHCLPKLSLKLSGFNCLNKSLPTQLDAQGYTVVKPSLDEVSSCNSLAVWHHRLGHANFNSVKQILRKCNVSLPNKHDSLLCKSCNLGKAHRLHDPTSTTVYDNAFDIIYSDLWGPSPNPSSPGYRYYIAFVDGHTRYTWLYFLKQKSEALQSFKLFHVFIQTQFKTTIKSVQSDYGGKLRSFSKFLVDLSISHRLTCSHTSHQSGYVERKHIHIVEMSLTLLAHSSIPVTYWDHSFSTAVYLINRLPSSILTKFDSPYHALYNKHPSYQTLKVFTLVMYFRLD